MRTVLNHTILSAACLLTALAAATVSCRQEELPATTESKGVAAASDEALVSIRVGAPVDAETKSVVSGTNFESGIRSLLVLFVGEDGSWKKSYSSASSGYLTTGQGQVMSLEPVTLKAQAQRYDIYAFANMGDVTASIPLDGAGKLNPAAYVHPLPASYADLAASGMPMCVSTSVSASALQPYSHAGVYSCNLTLRRLLSKVVVKVVKNKDATGMLYGAPDGSALQGGSLKVKQVPKVLRPFAPEADRRAQSTSELYTGDSDYHNFTASDGQSLQSSEVVLYVPENRQGANGSVTGTQAAKTPASGRGELSTYLEYTATKNGSSDGVSGHLTYKAYLGENETSDFNVIGDKVYTATLSLSWDGMWEGSWRVSQGDWADTRALVISAAAGSATAMTSTNTKAGSQKVRKASPTAFYMNFFPGGTSGSVAHGRKDMDSWPYGWVAYVDGSSVNMSGTSGTIKNASNQSFISWSYDSETDCLSMQSIAGAPANSDIHTLQFKTLDGRKSSNVVYFTASIPFEYQWKANATPNHVAQRGILKAIDPDTGNPSSEAIIKLKDANSSQVRLTDNGDGTAVVELIDGFSSIENAIRIADSDDDRECLVPLEGRVPWFETGTINPEINYVDATSNIRFTYLAAAADGSKSATALKVINNKGAKVVCAGENLDLDLVNELIAPVMGGGSSSSLLGYEYSPDNDGNLNIRIHIHTYAGVNALIGSNTNKTFTVGKTSLAMPSVSGGHSQAADMQDFRAYNPWRLITSLAQGGVMNDYTLYNEPARDGTKMAVGWSATPQNKPSETAEWTTSIGNVIIKDASHLSYNASFQDGAGYLGSKVCSHVGTGPTIVGPEFEPSASSYYRLIIRVPNLNSYDWETIGDFLWYGYGHYLDSNGSMLGSVWTNPDATPAQRKSVVDDAFSGGYIYITGWENTADAAWERTSLPAGISKTTPTAISGVSFEIQTRSETISSTWTLRYTMKDMEESDVKTHNAGKIDVVLRITNPFNSLSPSLDKKVAEAYVKLHLYVWPAPYGVVPVSPAWEDGLRHGWGYNVFPYCYTNGKRVPALDNRNFWDKQILIPATETYVKTNAPQTAFLKGMSSKVGAISRETGRSAYGSATYQFYNNDAFSDSDTEAKKMSKLMGYMSDNQTTSPFMLRIPTDYKRNEIRYSEQVGTGWQPYYENDVTYEGLNKVLGSATFHREDAYTLYYDPTGGDYKYTYAVAGSNPETTDKLFVIHIGGNTTGIRDGHYFDPAWF